MNSDAKQCDDYMTRRVSLACDYPEETYRHWKARAEQALSAAAGSVPDAAQVLQEEIHEWIRDGAPELESGLYSDILRAAIDAVDYEDIALSMLEGVTSADASAM